MAFEMDLLIKENTELKAENKELKRKISIFEANLSSQEAIFNNCLEQAIIRQTQQFEEALERQAEKFEKIIADKDAEIDALKKQILKLHSRLDNNANNSGIATASTPIHKDKRVPNLRMKSDKKRSKSSLLLIRS